MSDFPDVLSEVVDNVDDALAKYINNLEAKVGIDNSQVESALDYWLHTGWIPGVGTWEYASATEITVPSGAALLYCVGDAIRLKQGGAYLYFKITAVADELLTITGGTSYVLAEAAITDHFYSHSPNPIGFPSYFTFTIAFTGTGIDIGNAAQTSTFSINGKLVTVMSLITFGSTTNFGSGDFTFSLPVTASTVNTGIPLGVAQLRDAGTTREIAIISGNDVSTITIYPYTGAARINSDIPWTWVSTDQIFMKWSYYI